MKAGLGGLFQPEGFRDSVAALNPRGCCSPAVLALPFPKTSMCDSSHGFGTWCGGDGQTPEQTPDTESRSPELPSLGGLSSLGVGAV